MRISSMTAVAFVISGPVWLQRSLDYEGNLDRSPENVESIFTHGE